MIQPLDDSRFTHFIEIEGVGLFGEYQVPEPIGFDIAKFTKEQNSKRCSRDREYASLTTLKYIDVVGAKMNGVRAINPQGQTSEYLDYGLQWLLYAYKLYAGETKAYYILKENGIAFKKQQLDFSESKATDGYTYIQCKIIQNGSVNKVKSTFDSTLNAFSTKNWSEETIEPMPTFNYLRKATPFKQQSVWEMSGQTIYNNVTLDRYNPNATLTGDILNSLIAIENRINTGFSDALENFTYIKAKNQLTLGSIEIDVKVTFRYRPNGESDTEGRFGLNIVKYKFPYNVGDDVETINPYNKLFSGSSNQDFTYEDIITLELPNLQPNEAIAIYWFDIFSSSATINNMGLTFDKYKFSVSYTNTAIDLVIKGSRWIDLLNQGSRFNQNIPINAPLFDVGGEHYNNVVFNKRMVNHKVDFFNTTPKEVFESTIENNCDYEINENEIAILHETDYYVNQEIAVFEMISDNEFSIEQNPKLAINKVELEFKKFEQDRTSKGTDESFHTQVEYKLLNEIGKDTFQRRFDFTRDSIAVQKMIDLEINSPTTSTTDDDSIYIEECVVLPPASFGNLGGVRRLLMRVIEGKLEIVNRDSAGEEEDVAFLWSNLGIGVGGQFQILSGENIGNYTIFSMNLNEDLVSTIITLTPSSGTTPNFTGDSFIEVKYFYNNVYLQTRTNEGFAFVSGISPKFGNLNYTLKRITMRFKQRFSAMLLSVKKDIVVAKFKSNGLVTTRKTTETENVIENAPILYEDLGNPLITQFCINSNVYASFTDVKNYLDAYAIIRGYVRIFDSRGRVYKGFSEKLDQEWKTNKLTLRLEQKFQTEYLKIDLIEGQYFVDDAPYDLQGVADWYKFQNDFIKLYDSQKRPISEDYKYNLVLLNNVIYESRIELETALGLL